jgi:hypothetical protein
MLLMWPTFCSVIDFITFFCLLFHFVNDAPNYFMSGIGEMPDKDTVQFLYSKITKFSFFFFFFFSQLKKIGEMSSMRIKYIFIKFLFFILYKSFESKVIF